MPVDPINELAEALTRAGAKGALQQFRLANVPSLGGSHRLTEENPAAAYPFSTAVAAQYTAGWTGTATQMAFTSDVSALDGAGNSVDIVAG